MNRSKMLSENTPFRLTPYELRTLECIAEGMSTKIIPEKMDKSYDAINSARRRIMKKTGARNAAHLVSIAYKNGILK